ncbi:MAG: hypothetical protein U0L20_00035 [Ruminococcus sp.]|nr:hypothetical protein [Ruminococcus sp.]
MNDILINKHQNYIYHTDFSDNITSSNNTAVKVINNIIDENKIINQKKTDAFSSEIVHLFSVDQNSKQLKEHLEQNDIYKGQIVDDLVSVLYEDLQDYTLDGCEMSLAERKVIDIEQKYTMAILGEVLQKIYIKHFDEPLVLAGICDCLCRFDLNEVNPWGPTMLAGLLNHKNETVQEYATLLIENWSDVSLLPMLESIDFSSKWLIEYVNEVIAYLKGNK